MIYNVENLNLTPFFFGFSMILFLLSYIFKYYKLGKIKDYIFICFLKKLNSITLSAAEHVINIKGYYVKSKIKW